MWASALLNAWVSLHDNYKVWLVLGPEETRARSSSSGSGRRWSYQRLHALFRKEPKWWVVSEGPPGDSGRDSGLSGVQEAMAWCIASTPPRLWAGVPPAHPVLPLALCSFHTHTSLGSQGQPGWDFRLRVPNLYILGCWVVLGGSYTLEC